MLLKNNKQKNNINIQKKNIECVIAGNKAYFRAYFRKTLLAS